MSPICGLINTPNLQFILFSNKLKFNNSNRLFKSTATQDSIMSMRKKTHYLCKDQMSSQRFKS